MMTGDARAVAASVAAELGIDTVLAEVLPEQKASKIDELKRSGKRVAMVGDGVNDAPALVTADVGIAIGAGTAVAVEAGDIVLVRSDPRDVPRIIALSRASYRKMIQNLGWATGYNVSGDSTRRRSPGERGHHSLPCSWCGAHVIKQRHCCR
jgi:P-type Cu2+ transporter